MLSNRSILIKLLIILAVVWVSQGYEYFNFVQQWPGSLCDTKQGCCYPTAGNPAKNFSINGLLPNDNFSSKPTYCDSNNPYKESKISDLIGRMKDSWPNLACPSGSGSKLWSHEWKKYGTCSESVLNQHDYFKAALNLKDKIDLLKILKESGIKPNGTLYSLFDIVESIRIKGGQNAGIVCNVDKLGTSQLYQIYFCADPTGEKLIKCPGLPPGGCATKIKFPSF